MAAEPTTPTKEQGGVSSAASEDGVSAVISFARRSAGYQRLIAAYTLRSRSSDTSFPEFEINGRV